MGQWPDLLDTLPAAILGDHPSLELLVGVSIPQTGHVQERLKVERNAGRRRRRRREIPPSILRRGNQHHGGRRESLACYRHRPLLKLSFKVNCRTIELQHVRIPVVTADRGVGFLPGLRQNHHVLQEVPVRCELRVFRSNDAHAFPLRLADISRILLLASKVNGAGTGERDVPAADT